MDASPPAPLDALPLQPDAATRCTQLVSYLAASITLITVIVA